MTTSPSDVPDEAGEPTEGVTEDGPAEFAAALSARIGAIGHTTDHDTVRISVEPGRWLESVRAVGEDLPFFSWLSAVDWARDVAVGEAAAKPDELVERIDVMCRLSSITSSAGAVLVTSLPHQDPALDSIVSVFAGAGWHEREAAEMFGIRFEGNPNLTHIYLPDSFEGHPLRKSYPLLSREVKPWPGIVDVEGQPSTENVEAAALAADRDTEGDEASDTGDEE